jgi:hypothetical protein
MFDTVNKKDKDADWQSDGFDCGRYQKIPSLDAAHKLEVVTAWRCEYIIVRIAPWMESEDAPKPMIFAFERKKSRNACARLISKRSKNLIPRGYFTRS